MKHFAGTLIQIAHFCLVIFMIVVPLKKDTHWTTDLLHMTVALSLLVHWQLSNDACFLTFLEAYVRGIPHSSSFMHRLVSPVYIINDKTLSQASYIVTIIGAISSAYKLWTKRHAMWLDINIARLVVRNGGVTV